MTLVGCRRAARPIAGAALARAWARRRGKKRDRIAEALAMAGGGGQDARMTRRSGFVEVCGGAYGQCEDDSITRAA